MVRSIVSCATHPSVMALLTAFCSLKSSQKVFKSMDTDGDGTVTKEVGK